MWSGAAAPFQITVSEGGIRSPLLVAGPRVKGGRRVDAFSYVTDIMPSILEMAGLKHPSEFRGRVVERMRGRSIVGILGGSKKQIYDAEAFIGGEMLNGKWMRQGNYKAVSVAPRFGSGEWQLYNVAEDPGETNDLSI